MPSSITKMASIAVAVVALIAPLAHSKPLSHSQRTSNTFTNTTLEDMTATEMMAPTPTDADLGCFETYTPLPDETCGELASDYGIFLSDFEADYAADSEFCQTMLTGQGYCASKEEGVDEGYDGTSIVYADATVTLDDFGNPAVGPAVTPAPREAPEPSVTETTITFSAVTTLTYTIGTEGARQERTKVITHTDVQVETFSLLNAVATGAPSAASVGTVTGQPGSFANATTTVYVHDTQTTSVISTMTMLANASSTLTTPSTPTVLAAKAYKSYTGNGTEAEGWPSEEDWLSFEDLFAVNQQQIDESCDSWDVARNSADEVSAIHESILDIANSTGVDSRFILATIMQSSDGCVRATTTSNSYLAAGLMQSPNGASTCNQSPAMLSSLSSGSDPKSNPGNVTTTAAITPCPPSTIHQMILDGTNGTDTRDGLAQMLRKPDANGRVVPDRMLQSVEISQDVDDDSAQDADVDADADSTQDVSRFYRAARWYNAGGVDPSGDLGKGCCMASFASDIANRLTGWVGWDREFDGETDEE